MSELKLFWPTAFLTQYSAYFKIFLLLLSVGMPLAILFFLYPLSFDKTFNGRAYYLFFVWLIVLEYALDWDKYKTETSRISGRRVFAFLLALPLPTVYVVLANFLGLNAAIMNSFKMYGVISPWLDNAPLAVEFLFFAVLFAIVVFFAYRLKGLVDFSLSIALLGIIGAIHTINILYPYGGFTPFQILVPTTATLSADILNRMGYETKLLLSSGSLTPTLFIRPRATIFSTAYWGGQIAWPCAGIESLLLYTIIMLLFLKKADIPRLQKTVYFFLGVAVTYLINILRLVTIFLIGVNGGDVWTFHNFYGQLYSALWITSYPLIIIGSRIIWSTRARVLA